MNNATFKAVLCGVLLSVFSLESARAQEDFAALINPTLDVELDLKSPHWQQSVGVAHRDVFYQNDGYNFNGLFLEISEYTAYNFDNQRIGMKVKYRFKDMYTGKHDELRLAQDYSLVLPLLKNLELGQKFSLEERFRDGFSLRPRYRAVLEHALSPETSIGVNGEILLNFGPDELPVYEYRASAFLSFQIYADLSATLGAQYRYENFTREATKEIYMISGFVFKL